MVNKGAKDRWRWFAAALVGSLAVASGCVQDPEPAATSDAGSGRVLQVADEDFQRQVLENPALVMLDVWAPWCKPCRELNPIVEELSASYQGRVVFAKLNLDDNPRTAKAYQIQGVPTLLFFRSGRLVERIEGLGPKSELVQKLDSLLSSS